MDWRHLEEQGIEAWNRGDAERGQALLDEAVRTAEASGETAGLGRLLCRYGVLLARSGSTEAADALARGLGLVVQDPTGSDVPSELARFRHPLAHRSRAEALGIAVRAELARSPARPLVAQLHAALGEQYAEIGDFSLSARAYERAASLVERADERAEYWRQRAHSLEQLGDLAEALSVRERIVELQEGWGPGLRLARDCEAVALLQSLRHDDADVDYWSHRAIQLRRACEGDESEIEGWLAYAECLDRLGDTDRAEAARSRARSVGSASPEA